MWDNLSKEVFNFIITNNNLKDITYWKIIDIICNITSKWLLKRRLSCLPFICQLSKSKQFYSSVYYCLTMWLHGCSKVSTFTISLGIIWREKIISHYLSYVSWASRCTPLFYGISEKVCIPIINILIWTHVWVLKSISEKFCAQCNK